MLNVNDEMVKKMVPQQMTIWDFGEVYEGLLMPALAPRLKILEILFVFVRMEL